MTREELLKSREYWMANIQLAVFEMMENFRISHDLKKKDIAEKLGVTKGYITQVLNGDFDHKLSKLVDLSLAFGKVPKIDLIDLADYIAQDERSVSLATNKPIELKVIFNSNEQTQASKKKSEGVLLTKNAIIEVPNQLSKQLEYYSLAK